MSVRCSKTAPKETQAVYFVREVRNAKRVNLCPKDILGLATDTYITGAGPPGGAGAYWWSRVQAVGRWWKLHQAGAPAANSGAGPAGAGAPNGAVIALV